MDIKLKIDKNILLKKINGNKFAHSIFKINTFL